MNKPTDKQIKEFWEWCGLHYYPDCECIRGKGICWGESEETYGKNGHWHFALPSIVLNNLFEYAVPKFKFEYGGEALYKLLEKWSVEVALSREVVDPTLALFWTIYGARTRK